MACFFGHRLEGTFHKINFFIRYVIISVLHLNVTITEALHKRGGK